MSLIFTKRFPIQLSLIIFSYGFKWGNKNPLHFFDAGKQSLVNVASTSQKPGSHIASVCECFSVSEENYQKNGGPTARPVYDALFSLPIAYCLLTIVYCQL